MHMPTESTPLRAARNPIDSTLGVIQSTAIATPLPARAPARQNETTTLGCHA